MKRQIIRLTESDLHNIIKESVKRILKEDDREPWQVDYDNYMDHIDFDKEAGENKRKKYVNSLADAYPDKESRISALNRYINDREARRELRMSPEAIAAEKQWEREYNAKNGLDGAENDIEVKEIDPLKYRRKNAIRASKHKEAVPHERTMSDDELAARLEALKNAGMIK